MKVITILMLALVTTLTACERQPMQRISVDVDGGLSAVQQQVLRAFRAEGLRAGEAGITDTIVSSWPEAGQTYLEPGVQYRAILRPTGNGVNVTLIAGTVDRINKGLDTILPLQDTISQTATGKRSGTWKRLERIADRLREVQ